MKWIRLIVIIVLAFLALGGALKLSSYAVFNLYLENNIENVSWDIHTDEDYPPTIDVNLNIVLSSCSFLHFICRTKGAYYTYTYNYINLPHITTIKHKVLNNTPVNCKIHYSSNRIVDCSKLAQDNKFELNASGTDFDYPEQVKISYYCKNCSFGGLRLIKEKGSIKSVIVSLYLPHHSVEHVVSEYTSPEPSPKQISFTIGGSGNKKESGSYRLLLKNIRMDQLYLISLGIIASLIILSLGSLFKLIYYHEKKR